MKHEELFGGANWVAPSETCSQPLMRAVFTASGDEDAEITICGLGFFELFCNGQKVSPDLLVPGWTDYEDHVFLHDGKPITETRGHRTLVLRYALKDFLRKGKNVLGIALGAGWYEFFEYGRVKACFRLTLCGEGSDQVILSGKEMKWAPSQILVSKMLHGETHDTHLDIEGWAETEFDDSMWKSVKEVPAPESEFFLQSCPADRIASYRQPILLSESNGVRVYDAGVNLSGYAVLHCPEGAEGEVIVTYAEELLEDGSVDCASYSYGDPALYHIDRFLLDGKERELFPRFLWHGFRYFSVAGNAKAVRVAFVHTDVPVTSSFTSGSEDLNWLYETYVHTQLSNMHAGIPSDCPHREGRGYTGDGQLTCDAVMTTLGAKTFYEKWMGDISDCQCRETGHIQYVAPYTPCGGGPGGWGCAIIVVPYTFFMHYADRSVLERYYPQMRMYLSYLEAHSDGDLVTREDPSWAWCLGDWCTPEKIAIPEPFVNTYFYIKSLVWMIEIARIIGRPEDIKEYERTLEIKRAALTEHFFDEKTGSFAGGIQGADAFAVDAGVGDERTFGNMVKKYRALSEYDTGIFGTDILTRVLFEKGEGQLAYDLLTSQKEVSFHSIRAKGATSLWEYWDGAKSRSHPMFGAVVRYLFQYLLGIRQKKDTFGWTSLTIEPICCEGLDWAKGSMTLPAGKIETAFVKTPDGTVFTVTIPEGVHAAFRFGSVDRKLLAGINEIFVK